MTERGQLLRCHNHNLPQSLQLQTLPLPSQRGLIRFSKCLKERKCALLISCFCKVHITKIAKPFWATTWMNTYFRNIFVFVIFIFFYHFNQVGFSSHFFYQILINISLGNGGMCMDQYYISGLFKYIFESSRTIQGNSGLRLPTFTKCSCYFPGNPGIFAQKNPSNSFAFQASFNPYAAGG